MFNWMRNKQPRHHKRQVLTKHAIEKIRLKNARDT